MPRYTKAQNRPRADWLDDDGPLIPCLTVDDRVAVDTGLIWETGESVMREPNPIGFGRDEDW